MLAEKGKWLIVMGKYRPMMFRITMQREEHAVARARVSLCLLSVALRYPVINTPRDIIVSDLQIRGLERFETIGFDHPKTSFKNSPNH